MSNTNVNSREPTANDIKQFLKLKKVANYLNDDTIGTIDRLNKKEIKLDDEQIEEVSVAVRKHINKAINSLRDEIEDNVRDQIKRSQNRILERVQELLDYQKTVNNVTKIKEDEDAKKEAEEEASKPPTSNNIINAMANIPNGITAIGSVIKNVSEKAYNIANNALGNNAPPPEQESSNQPNVNQEPQETKSPKEAELPQDTVDEIANQIVNQINDEKEEKENLEKANLEAESINQVQENQTQSENQTQEQKQLGGRKRRRKTQKNTSKKRKSRKRKNKKSKKKDMKINI